MNHKQKIRLVSIVSLLILVCMALTLILFALKQNINLFFTPTELHASIIKPNQIVRVGGYVKPHSVHYSESGNTVTFIVTDHVQDIFVRYQGVLPNLFREDQGIVVTGMLSEHFIFNASQVLAKHDEKYMPWSLNKKLNTRSAV